MVAKRAAAWERDYRHTLDRTRMRTGIIGDMRWMGLTALMACAASVWAQEAMVLPAAQTANGRVRETFRFVADGPAGSGWSRPDEIRASIFTRNCRHCLSGR